MRLALIGGHGVRKLGSRAQLGASAGNTSAGRGCRCRKSGGGCLACLKLHCCTQIRGPDVDAPRAEAGPPFLFCLFISKQTNHIRVDPSKA